MAQINATFGSGGMTLAINDTVLPSFIQFLKKNKEIDICKAASILGEQKCGRVWVMGPNLQVSIEGKIIPEDQYHYVWLDSGSVHACTASDILPKIKLPLAESPSKILKEMVMLLQTIMKHNFFSSLLTIAGSLMTFHYASMQSLGGCPTVVAIGEAETGKSTSLLTAMSVLGRVFISYQSVTDIILFIGLGHQNHIYERGTNAFFLDRSSQSTLPFVIDDPQKSSSKGSDTNELVVDLFSGSKVSSKQREVVPSSGALIASNFELSTLQR